MPSADDVLAAAVGLVLTGAGLPEATALPDGLGTATGFLASRPGGGGSPARCGHLVRGRHACWRRGRASGKYPRLRAGAAPGRVPR